MYGFILWVVLPIIGLVPAFFVKEDLRRLNMKDVEKSVYLYEKTLLKESAEGRMSIMLKHKIIADEDTLLYLHFESNEVEKRRSMHVVSQSVRLLEENDDDNGKGDPYMYGKRKRPGSFDSTRDGGRQVSSKLGFNAGAVLNKLQTANHGESG
jgi:hypothetical protein